MRMGINYENYDMVIFQSWLVLFFSSKNESTKSQLIRNW